jgi:hypothetical protein
MNSWLREPANSPYKYTLVVPAEPVVLAHARLAARHPAEMEIAS